MAEWIGSVLFDPEVSAKLRSKHNLDPADVSAAITAGAHDRAVWHTHEVYGRRLVVTGAAPSGRLVVVYLRPVDRKDGTWECLTAWELE